MSKKHIYYSDKYNDEEFEYRYEKRFEDFPNQFLTTASDTNFKISAMFIDNLILTKGNQWQYRYI